MPILEVEIAGQSAAGTAQRIADAVGEALGAEPGSVWVRLRHLAPSDYAENAAAPPEPVFVSVTRADVPAGAALAGELALLTRAVAAACGRPAERVHVAYAPPARGRSAFGGKPVE